ncbi:MAG TPA: protein kinase [Vicinamibacteria bacterium]|nr:protein kinase [Vicinamibacteria bacterium]
MNPALFPTYNSPDQQVDMIGRTLSHYKILEKLGSGGMGDVYLAEDTQLDRKVAFKILPPEMAEDEKLRERFKREAKAIAALDHPNIVQVFSVEEAEGIHFITMQLVQGETLKTLLPKDGLPLSKFFDIAIPLADAVAAAHQEGITHRDLKPDNLMVSEDGRVKVLDFGLAKPTGGVSGAGSVSELRTAARTEVGVIVGTLNYMSPEQAQGKSMDARSDIFSLGIVLYEMLTGRRPFGGETSAEVLSSIIKDAPPPVTTTKREVPRELARLIQRCLVKEPGRRLQSALDLRNELEELKKDRDLGRHRTPASTWIMRGAAVAGLLAVVAFLWNLVPGERIPRFVNAVQVTSAVGVEEYPAWSPDAQILAYQSNQSGNWDIWVAPIGGEPLNRTGDYEGDDRLPSWSPDGSRIAFLSARDGGGVYEMSALAGTPRKVSSVNALYTSRPQWSADGDELSYSGIEILDADEPVFVEIVSLRGDESRRIPLPELPNLVWDLSWSPDGRFLAFVDAGGSTETAEVTRLGVLRLSDGEVLFRTDGRTNDRSPNWSSDGRTLYFVSNRGGAMDLWAQPLAEDRTAIDPPAPLTTGMGFRNVQLSPDEIRLAYSKGRPVSNAFRISLSAERPVTWADAEQLSFDQAFVEFLDISQDGDRLLVSSDRAGNPDLWLMFLQTGELRQLTTDIAPDWNPRWSPDERDIAFYSHRSGNRDIWIMPASGGSSRQLTRNDDEDWLLSWSHDGTKVAYLSSRGMKPWVVPADGGEPRQLREYAVDFALEWSPDGKWLAFVGEADLGPYVWRVPVEGGEPERLTKGQVRTFRWARDGKKIYYLGRGDRAGTIWELSLEDGSEHPLTDFVGRRGSLGGLGLSTDGRDLYFTWEEDLGDIWVMDVTDER